VFLATVVAKLTYCVPAWSGLCSANDRAGFVAFLRRSKRYEYSIDDDLMITELLDAADQSLFKRIMNNEQQLLVTAT